MGNPMLNAADVKYWIRSGSLGYALKRRLDHEKNGECSFLYRSRPVFFRPGTSDTMVIEKTLLKPTQKREYRFPADFDPKVILDIGANMGATSILLSNQYPNATIHCFEPEPSNFRLLAKNATRYPNIKCYEVGLGNADKECVLYSSDDVTNFGGFSQFERGVDKNRKTTIAIKNISTYLKTIGIKEVDLIKIDIEGAEFDVLTAMEREVLGKVGWIFGELHGERDFELLSCLSEHFDISLKKSLGDRISVFQARNKKILPSC